MKIFEYFRKTPKEIKLNGHKYFLCESDKDLNAGRFKDFQQLTIMKETGISPLDFLGSTVAVIKAQQELDMRTSILAYEKQITGINMMVNQKSAIEYLFALIVTEKEEDLSEFKKEEADRKLKQFYKEGLQYGQMESIVEDFLKGCSSKWWLTFQMNLNSLKVTE